MPIRKVEGGFKWGDHGHVYKTRGGAAAQARAAYANGYRGDAAQAAMAQWVKDHPQVGIGASPEPGPPGRDGKDGARGPEGPPGDK